MANNYTKTMRQALEEARSFRDVTTEGGPGSGPQKGGKKQSSADIKKAYGILNDPRYKQGNYSGAAKAIDKLSPGLSNHPDVKNAMKRANEELDETMVVTKVDKDTNSPAYQKFKAGDKRYVYKEESQITEKKAEFLRIDFRNKNEVDKIEGWMYKNISQVNAPYDSVVFNKHRLDGFSVEFEGMDDADALMTKLKRAGFRFKVDMREGNINDIIAEQVELDKEWVIMSERTYTMKYDVATGKDFPKKPPFGTDGSDSMYGRNTPYLGGRGAAKAGKKYSDNPHKVAAKKLHWSRGYVDYKKNPGKYEEVEQVDEAAFSQAQIDTLKKAYGSFSSTGVSMNNMNKLRDTKKRYSKDNLSQLAKLDIPMVSKTAKELL